MVTKYPDYDLSARNTFRMKVRCALYVEVTEEADLPALDWDALPQPLMVIGGDSNLLFTADFPGTVLHFAGSEPCPGVDKPSEGRATTAPESSPAGEVGVILGRGGILSCLPSPENVPSRGLGANNDGRGDSHEIPPRPLGPDSGGLLLATVPAGSVFDDFCAWAAENGLWGPENLSLIPGECGASAVQNIGAYGVEAKDIIAAIRAWDLQERRFVTIDPADCAYGYRTSRFKTDWKGRFVITAVTYRLSQTPQPKLDYGGIRKALEARGVGTGAGISGHPRPDKREGPKEARSAEYGRGRSEAEAIPAPVPAPRLTMEAEFPEGLPLTPQLIRETIIDIRRKKLPDPAEKGSAGSFFCNPVISREHFARIVATAREENGPDYQVPHYEVGDQIKVPAAWMIEQCGFKGATNGGAKVYENQPLVIVNDSGEASPEEIIGLEQRIIRTIEGKYGITLHPEVEHI